MKASPKQEEEGQHVAGGHQNFHYIVAGTSVGSSHRLLLEVADNFVPWKSPPPADSAARILQSYDCVRWNSNNVLLPARPALEQKMSSSHGVGMRHWKDAHAGQNVVEDSSRFAVVDTQVEVRCSIQW